MSVGTFVCLLTLIFITLKLTGYIAWSWLAVLSPLWILVLVVILVALAVSIWSK